MFFFKISIGPNYWKRKSDRRLNRLFLPKMMHFISIANCQYCMILQEYLLVQTLMNHFVDLVIWKRLHYVIIISTQIVRYQIEKI